ncbi:xanthosine phosphorylase [Massilia sp. YIM B02443]|jgi:xanthosine phosphorylase|uniref:xanthosine phosphorylase n=1 Tax=Massilia sp. YIM B02443 TaxID=3050127 RepID=UPI0025B6FC86|nr:xanthosine phosphorylase [Massilia sp. YIM B02443]MDN4036125.1 xanthosine phosphorylase [Massilia sp. YIM B02443]
MSSNTPFEAADIIRARKPGFTPRVALILGSGLGVLAEQLTDAVSIGYAELPGFPISTVHGHAGELVLGEMNGVPVACMKGRGHFYEGYGPGVMTSAIRTLKEIGCELLFVTNAAGSLNVEADAGSLVAITDHINFLPGSPMAGPNDDRFGPRFFSMSNAYDADTRAEVKAAAQEKGITLHEGVYLAAAGPHFETVAEIRAFKTLGADVVGMSLIPEVIAARHCGLKVTAVSAITNLAEGLSPFALSHDQTLKYAAIAAQDMVALIPAFIERFGKTPRAAA